MATVIGGAEGASTNSIQKLKKVWTGRFVPRVVNGVASQQDPAVAALLQVSDDGGLSLSCSGTLIGCSTVLTAAHCFCEGIDDAAACMRSGSIEDVRRSAIVGLQHAGGFEISSVTIHPQFQFGVGGDLAVVRLAKPVTGIRPIPLNASSVPVGTGGRIVGFGETIDNAFNTGIKRSGHVITSLCSGHVPDTTHLCWDFTLPLGFPGDDSNTCHGDSGGPLLIQRAGGESLAGVTSGGEPSCLPNSISWNTDVAHYHDWIKAAAGTTIGQALCGTIPQVGDVGTQISTANGELSFLGEHPSYRFTVPQGARSLRLALNGEVRSIIGLPNDFDLYVKAGEPPIQSSDCASTQVGPFEYCEFDQPIGGVWHVSVVNALGSGAFQITATTFSDQLPSPSSTVRSPTRTASRTATPTAAQTAPPTPSRSRTPSPTQTRLPPSPTRTLAPFATLSATRTTTRTRTVSPSPTRSASITPRWTPTATPTIAICQKSCGAGGSLSEEAVHHLAHLLFNPNEISNCPAVDDNRDGRFTVNEITALTRHCLAAVSSATPTKATTASPTQSPRRSATPTSTATSTRTRTSTATTTRTATLTITALPTSSPTLGCSEPVVDRVTVSGRTQGSGTGINGTATRQRNLLLPVGSTLDHLELEILSFDKGGALSDTTIREMSVSFRVFTPGTLAQITFHYEFPVPGSMSAISPALPEPFSTNPGSVLPVLTGASVPEGGHEDTSVQMTVGTGDGFVDFVAELRAIGSCPATPIPTETPTVTPPATTPSPVLVCASPVAPTIVVSRSLPSTYTSQGGSFELYPFRTALPVEDACVGYVIQVAVETVRSIGFPLSFTLRTVVDGADEHKTLFTIPSGEGRQTFMDTVGYSGLTVGEHALSVLIEQHGSGPGFYLPGTTLEVAKATLASPSCRPPNPAPIEIQGSALVSGVNLTANSEIDIQDLRLPFGVDDSCAFYSVTGSFRAFQSKSSPQSLSFRLAMPPEEDQVRTFTIAADRNAPQLVEFTVAYGPLPLGHYELTVYAQGDVSLFVGSVIVSKR